MKIKIIFIILLLLIISAYISVKNRNEGLIINNKKIELLIANNDYLRQKGLSDRESIPENTAMLFVFDKADKYGFWMKDMKFPLDIVWLNEKKEIVYLLQNIKPDTYPDTFFPIDNAMYIIEFNAGFSEKNNIKVGNVLNFKI